MAAHEILIPTQLQRDRVEQLSAAVTAATKMDRSYMLKSDQFRKILKGFALGAFRELKSEGMENVASAVIFEAKK